MTTIINGSSPSITFSDSTTQSSGINATAGVVGVTSGGTGLATTPANGALDIGNGSGFTRTTLTAGTGVTITNGAGSITIAASGGSGVTSLNGNTGALLGYDKIASATLSGNNSSVNITGIPTGYSQLIIMGEFRVDTGGSDTVFPIRLSTNNGSSYISTSSYYQQFVYYDLGTGPNYSNFLTDSGFGFAAVGGNGRGWMGGTTGYSTFCVIINQPTTTSFPSCQWNQGFQNTASDYSWYWGTGFNNSTNSYINAFQITRQSGNKNITGGYINVFGTKVA